MVLADPGKNGNLSEISVDEILKNMIHMPVEVEDDPPEEF